MTDATSVHGPWPEVTAVGCQRGHLGQLARREDTLGLPGLPRRFSPSSESHQRDPPLVAPSRLACMDLPKVPGHQPHGSCLRMRAEVNGIIATWRLRLITPHVGAWASSH